MPNFARMNKLLPLVGALFLLQLHENVHAQNVGIGTTTPLQKLHVAGGLRVDTLANGTDSGLLRHNTLGTVYTLKFTGDSTQMLRGNGSFGNGAGWNLKGNARTTAASNFIGTTDNQPLLFKTNNVLSGKLDAVNGNIFFGPQAGANATTGYSNVAVGARALYNNSDGSNIVAIGDSALYSEASGTLDNTAVGSKALFTNSFGFENTAVGFSSLYNNTFGSDNTAAGTLSLNANTTGIKNTAMGSVSLYANSTGSNNTANGYYALFGNTSGGNNTGYGSLTLYLNTTGNYNTAVGFNTLRSNTTGSNNTAIGSGADVNGSGLTNATAIGSGAVVAASNRVCIGNSSVTVIEGQVPFTTTSDGRYKFNIREDVKGLDFILRLRPVTYQFDVKRFNQVIQTSYHPSANAYDEAVALRRAGFIAQEVEKAATESGYDFSGINRPKTEQDHYSLSYESFVVPLVKAMQEQQQIIEAQHSEMEEQNKKIEALINEVKALKTRHK